MDTSSNLAFFFADLMVVNGNPLENIKLLSSHGGDRACDGLPGALEAIVVDLRREGPASTQAS
jgi:hypothetical protein